MRILAYVVSFALVYTIGGLIVSWISIIPASINARTFLRKFTFWDSYGTGTIECVLLMFLSWWSFSWFGYDIPLLYALILTVAFTLNNINRIRTRPNLGSELGYFASQLIGFLGFYFVLVKSNIISYTLL